MDLFSIVVDDKKFTYIDSITIDRKNYVAFMDDKDIYVSEYKLDKGDITFEDVDDTTYDLVIKKLDL